MMTESELKEKVNHWLFQMMGSDELVERWWQSPNRYWDGRTPTDIWVNSSHQEVVNYVKKFLHK